MIDEHFSVHWWIVHENAVVSNIFSNHYFIFLDYQTFTIFIWRFIERNDIRWLKKKKKKEYLQIVTERVPPDFGVTMSLIQRQHELSKVSSGWEMLSGRCEGWLPHEMKPLLKYTFILFYLFIFEKNCLPCVGNQIFSWGPQQCSKGGCPLQPPPVTPVSQLLLWHSAGKRNASMGYS